MLEVSSGSVKLSGNLAPCKNGMIQPLKPMQIKKLKKEIENSYSKFMCGVQVNIMNLSKVSSHVFDSITLRGVTMEDAYKEAKTIYGEN
jgi:hypothetical protein